MKPVIPVLFDIPGDTPNNLMGRDGNIVGWNKARYVVRYGYSMDSEEHRAHGCYLTKGSVWVLCDYAGNILERISGWCAADLPSNFLTVLNDPLRTVEKPDTDKLKKCAVWLTEKSNEICEANECTEDEHKCDSYAYFKLTENDFGDITDFEVIDVCSPDYLTTQADLALPLPFHGDHNDLLDAMERYRD